MGTRVVFFFFFPALASSSSWFFEDCHEEKQVPAAEARPWECLRSFNHMSRPEPLPGKGSERGPLPWREAASRNLQLSPSSEPARMESVTNGWQRGVSAASLLVGLGASHRNLGPSTCGAGSGSRPSGGVGCKGERRGSEGRGRDTGSFFSGAGCCECT